MNIPLLADYNIKKSITLKAEELGFVKVGFAKAEALEKESEHLNEWLKRSYDADMKWIGKSFDKRKDIRLIMPEAKTVISLAYNYYTDFRHDEARPKISRYAWGKDYHKVIKKKLKELCGFIETLTPLNPPFLKGRFSLVTKFYVDDGPVMDKSWAVRAGIGWIGKHTNVINPEYGSWIFLSEIITNLELETYDEPTDDLCGSCRICIYACPTGAIVDEYVLDAKLCISYHTIENHREIPEHINLHGWIFGCDICQDVCPFNKNDKPTMDKDFYPNTALRTPLNPPFGKGGTERSEGGFKSKTELEAITEAEFNLLFADSPIKRTKYKGWKRNLEKI